MNAHQEKDTKVMSNGHHSPTMKNKEINGSSPKMHKKRKWCIPSSDMSRRTVNPIRRVVDTMRIEPNPSYSPISLSIGDPTVFGNLLPHPNMLEAIEESLHSHKHNGYGPAIGNLEARKAIAKCMTVPEAPLTEKDIVITSACSGAIEICIGTLANPGDNMLCPKPGFSLYKTIGTSNGVDVRYYNLMPDKEWQVDLEHMESLIDEKTKFIVVNNPSNPCGSVYTRQHLLAILEVAERNKLPILADEIYAYSVFPGETFLSISQSYNFSTSSFVLCYIEKIKLKSKLNVPGWRLGWIQIHDRNDLFKEVRAGLADMATRILGANSIIQGALPRILLDTPQDWFDENMAFIEDITNVACNSLSKVPGLKCIRPRGAMYMMVGIDKTILKSIKDDIHFTTDLMAKKSVFCLPGTCFQFPDYFRVVLTVPRGMVEEACARIEEYCREIIEPNSVD